MNDPARRREPSWEVQPGGEVGRCREPEALLHQILERLEALEERTVSLEEYREALRCPECGAEMTAEPVVALKK